MQKTFLKSKLAFAVLTIMSVSSFAQEQSGQANDPKQDTTKLKTIVVTSASGYEQNIANTAATISVITGEELAKKSYSDVTDALKNVPGVFVQGGGTNQTISIRGMGSAYTLFLIDGKPMNDGSLLTTNGGVAGASVNFLPPIEAIERIEVIRGPSSSLYGSDAMGGVINIITKKHQDHLTGSIRTEYIKAGKSNDVNNDATNTSLYVNAPLIDKLLSLQVNAGFQTIEESDFQKNSTEAAESDPEFTKKNLGAKFVYTPDDKNTITAEYLTTQQERTHTPGKSMLPEGNARTTELVKNNYNLTHEGKYENLVLNSYLQYDKDKNTTATGRTASNPGGISFETITANSQGTYFFDQHNLTVGGRFLHENLEDGATNQEPTMAGKVTKMDRYQWSLFTEDTWNVSDDLALTLSARYDENEIFGSNFSPKAYAVYKANDNFTLKGGVISGYKAPSLRDSSTDYRLGSMGGAIIANPDLKPESSLTYETGIAFEDSDLGLTASLMVYHTDFKDKITRSGRLPGSRAEDENGVVILEDDPTFDAWFNNSEFYQANPDLPYSSTGYTRKFNVDKATIQGIELTTDYQFTDYLKYRHSYTYTDSEQKSGVDKGKPLNDLPKHMFNAGLDWDVNDQLLLWTQLNYRGETAGTSQDVRTPSYTFVDLGAVYTYTDQLQFSTGIYNVANKNVSEDGNNYVLDGRRYSFALNYKF